MDVFNKLSVDLQQQLEVEPFYLTYSLSPIPIRSLFIGAPFKFDCFSDVHTNERPLQSRR